MFLTEGQNENNSERKPDGLNLSLLTAFACDSKSASGEKIASEGVLDLRQESSDTLPHDIQKECSLQLIQ